MLVVIDARVKKKFSLGRLARFHRWIDEGNVYGMDYLMSCSMQTSTS